MALTIQTSADGKTVTIRINGRFDFKVYREFQQVYDQAPPPDATYIVDLGQTDYLDSSALGMLLLLREHAGGGQADIRIVRCPPEVHKILTIANFHQLFNVS
jgi:anti-anti-sigma factor